MTRLRAALLILIAILQGVWVAYAVWQLEGNDFGIFYRSAAAADPYVGSEGNPRTATGEHLTNLNPPHFLLLIKPLTLLPFPVACAVWWLGSAVLAAWGLTWWLREQQERWNVRNVVWAVLWTPLVALACTGQVAAILGVPLFLAYVRLRDRDDWWGGVMVGVVASIKPFLWPLLIWFLIRRAWATVQGAAAGAALAVAAGVAVFGIDLYWRWFETLQRVTWGAEVMNMSLVAIGSRLPLSTPKPLWTILGVALAVGTIAATRRWPIRQSWMPLLGVSLIASPLGWIYYGAWLLPGTRRDDWQRGPALAWCTPLLLQVLITSRSPLLQFAIESIYGITLLGIWVRALHRQGTWFAPERTDEMSAAAPGRARRRVPGDDGAASRLLGAGARVEHRRPVG